MFLYVCKQTFRKSKLRISQKVKGVIMCNLCGTFFYVMTNVFQDFHICFSVTLKTKSVFCIKCTTYWGSSVKFHVHVRVEWFWILKLKDQVIRFQKHLISLNCPWSVATILEKMCWLSKYFKIGCVINHLIRNFMLISNHIMTIDQKWAC